MNRNDLFQKCRNFTRHKEAQAGGFYHYFKPIQSGAGPEVTIAGRRFIMAGSNNYLGLTQHPRVIAAAKAAIDKYGSGCTGSRFLNGTLDLHEELESRLARFMRKEKCVLFSTGFQTNLGIISTLVSRDDAILCDRMNHASIIDGCRLSFGRTIKYKHCDLYDLERILDSVDIEEDANAGTLVVTDGVFSMEGDLAPLRGLVSLKKKYPFRLMVDDAHGVGVMGATGRGTAEHFGVEDEVDVIMGTFSKSFASLGGFVVGDVEVIDYVKHLARALIFSASMPPANVATALAALDIMENDSEPRVRLWENTRMITSAFRQMGFNTGNSESPVVPVILDEERVFQFNNRLWEEGIFVNAIIPPAVPPGTALLRVSMMATHTPEMVKRIIRTFESIGKELQVCR